MGGCRAVVVMTIAVTSLLPGQAGRLPSWRQVYLTLVIKWPEAECWCLGVSEYIVTVA